MIKITFLLSIAAILFSCLAFSLAYGDGLASETLPPAMIGNINTTLSINSSPFLIDINHSGTQLNFVLVNAVNQQPIPQATIAVSAFKGDAAIFGHVLKSDSGNFLLNLIPDSTADKISITEEGGLFLGLALGHGGNYDIKGPAFDSGGLYKFKIDVLTMGTYDNQVSKSYNAAISIPETNQYQIDDNEYGKQNVTLIAYYDQIKNFQYNSNNKTMTFEMPFNWDQSNIKQVSVVHQELKIPKSFGDFIVTKYDAYVNGVKLPDKAVSIDDFSSDDRIIHLIVYREELSTIAGQNNGKSVMDYKLLPSGDTGFPIEQYTQNAQYKVSLSWDPPKILPGATTTFSFKVLDPYLINKTAGPMSYDFSIIAGKNGSIFHKHGTTNSDDMENTIDVKFPANYTGPITIAFENLNANSFADSEFSGVVSHSSTIPEFPSSSLLVIAIIFSSAIIFRKFSRI